MLHPRHVCVNSARLWHLCKSSCTPEFSGFLRPQGLSLHPQDGVWQQRASPGEGSLGSNATGPGHRQRALVQPMDTRRPVCLPRPSVGRAPGGHTHVCAVEPGKGDRANLSEEGYGTLKEQEA